MSVVLRRLFYVTVLDFARAAAFRAIGGLAFFNNLAATIAFWTFCHGLFLRVDKARQPIGGAGGSLCRVQG